jgi:25S rRNA (uracil2843-N3)-methyltransferase
MASRKGAPSGAKASTSNNTKKPPKKTQTTVSSRNVQDEQDQRQTASNHDRKHQQRVLDVFRHAFNDILSSPSFTATLQSVKQALYDRDFARAFGDPEHLAVYAARWSPTRALCYASVLAGIKEHLEPLLLSSSVDPTPTENQDETETVTTPTNEHPHLQLLSIGGGAAELVAFGSFLNQHPSPLSGSITLLDSGPWQPVITTLTTALTTPPPISKYASAATKLSNTPLVPASHLTPTFLQQDALTLNATTLTPLLGTDPLLITILFTLNELFTASGIGKTTAFLLNLTSAVPIGSLLLVVDSPGSYSETSVGKEAKRYPMQWLLDRIMLGTRREPVRGRRWAKVEAAESVWFRLAEGAGLEYPIPLENMRYRMHLYRAEDASLGDDD